MRSSLSAERVPDEARADQADEVVGELVRSSLKGRTKLLRHLRSMTSGSPAAGHRARGCRHFNKAVLEALMPARGELLESLGDADWWSQLDARHLDLAYSYHATIMSLLSSLCVGAKGCLEDVQRLLTGPGLAKLVTVHAHLEQERRKQIPRKLKLACLVLLLKVYLRPQSGCCGRCVGQCLCGPSCACAMESPVDSTCSKLMLWPDSPLSQRTVHASSPDSVGPSLNPKASPSLTACPSPSSFSTSASTPSSLATSFPSASFSPPAPTCPAVSPLSRAALSSITNGSDEEPLSPPGGRLCEGPVGAALEVLVASVTAEVLDIAQGISGVGMGVGVSMVEEKDRALQERYLVEGAIPFFLNIPIACHSQTQLRQNIEALEDTLRSGLLSPEGRRAVADGQKQLRKTLKVLTEPIPASPPSMCRMVATPSPLSCAESCSTSSDDSPPFPPRTIFAALSRGCLAQPASYPVAKAEMPPQGLAACGSFALPPLALGLDEASTSATFPMCHSLPEKPPTSLLSLKLSQRRLGQEQGGQEGEVRGMAQFLEAWMRPQQNTADGNSLPERQEREKGEREAAPQTDNVRSDGTTPAVPLEPLGVSPDGPEDDGEAAEGARVLWRSMSDSPHLYGSGLSCLPDDDGLCDNEGDESPHTPSSDPLSSGNDDDIDPWWTPEEDEAFDDHHTDTQPQQQQHAPTMPVQRSRSLPSVNQSFPPPGARTTSTTFHPLMQPHTHRRSSLPDLQSAAEARHAAVLYSTYHYTNTRPSVLPRSYGGGRRAKGGTRGARCRSQALTVLPSIPECDEPIERRDTERESGACGEDGQAAGANSAPRLRMSLRSWFSSFGEVSSSRRSQLPVGRGGA
ncbi:unnamed protein product [Vitrella brassicaformis CCMP3155]|uniref:Uncharacterized protein n=1 Tax=Vitrella brassicaformis (strain CCMP3155) TaxID=1169540 RepID=A0A0G4ELQ6_VITBC|nr:unnamed protein product [Vitrella brassicaformis CCMP3155]|mmetsp:Transcript_44691/g.111140  ORF Transcript_44691/g.111140 Transcript_44691/m.111140 type:complete len:857 (-) Transcript_44691:149-2719(-)|eukprot:CEL98046.1 unnamed protein product [Vitrella brassicaformis CCMP3155]